MVLTSALSIFLVTQSDPKQSVNLVGADLKLSMSVPTVIDGWKLKRSRSDTSTKIEYVHSSLVAFGRPCSFTVDFRSKSNAAKLLQVEKSALNQPKPSTTNLKLEWRWDGRQYLEREMGTSQGIQIKFLGEADSLFVLGSLTYPGPLEKQTTNKLVAIVSRLTRGVIPNAKIKAL
ncbi:MAG: hypothetical protein WCI55_14500 [Armatimonadota bacterium]